MLRVEGNSGASGWFMMPGVNGHVVSLFWTGVIKAFPEELSAAEGTSRLSGSGWNDQPTHWDQTGGAEEDGETGVR